VSGDYRAKKSATKCASQLEQGAIHAVIGEKEQAPELSRGRDRVDGDLGAQAFSEV